MIHMQGFRVVSLGSISIIMRGNPLLDWLSNLIVKTVSFLSNSLLFILFAIILRLFQVTILFRGPITDFISLRFQELLQETIDEMNNRRFAATYSHDEIEQMLHNVLSLKGYAKPLM